jgi:PEP-CTERM motif
MLKVKKLAPLAAFAMAFTATPALADAITFDSSDIGTTYTLNYDGFSDGNTIGGLTAQTSFTLTGISGSTYTFDYAVNNTSSAPITGSRISSFAFDTNPDITSAASTGAFGYTTVGSSYPNGIGSVDACFKDASTGSCAGGGSGGLTIGQTGSGTFSLTFAQPVSDVTLSDFYVRYQSISGAGNVTSASGAGTQSSTTSSGGTTVPEPGMLGLLGGALVATALLRRRRRREDGALVPAFA